MFLNDLISQKRKLERLIERLSMHRDKVPGRIQAQQCKNHYQYVYFPDKDSRGEYLRKEQLDVARQVAQQNYEEKLLQAATMQLRDLCRTIKTVRENDMEAIYAGMKPARRSLVTPWIEPFESFANRWKDKEYTAYSYTVYSPRFYNSEGELMHSPSACVISDMLHELGIPYKPDYGLRIPGYGMVYMDFAILSRRSRRQKYIKNFGYMDDRSSAEKAINMLRRYPGAGLVPGNNLLFVFENSKGQIDIEALRVMVRRICC